MIFVGIDLAWKGTNPSGFAMLHEKAGALELYEAPCTLTGIQAILDAVPQDAPVVVSIDAPLILRNEKGQRCCENAVSRKFGGYHAGAHSSNLNMYSGRSPQSGALEDDLRKLGFTHYPDAADDCERVMLEVYPHPALVVLFDLKDIIRYKNKKRCVAERRKEFQTLQNHLLQLDSAALQLKRTDQLESFLSRNTSELRGRKMKEYEDQIDALICAYIAALSWPRRRPPLVEFLGSLENGYIVIPTHTKTGQPWPAQASSE